jgi:hypothetical protein
METLTKNAPHPTPYKQPAEFLEIHAICATMAKTLPP